MADQDQDQGNFLTGFTFGLFAGAMGYFLFGTQKGEEMRQQISQEWEQAKEEMVKSGVVESKHSIRDVIDLMLAKVAANIEEANQATTAKTHKQHREKRETKKFKGV